MRLGIKRDFFVIFWHSVDTFFNLNQLKILYETVDFNIVFSSKKHSDFFCYRKSLLHDTCFFKKWAFVMIMTNIIYFLLFKGVEVTDKTRILSCIIYWYLFLPASCDRRQKQRWVLFFSFWRELRVVWMLDSWEWLPYTGGNLSESVWRMKKWRVWKSDQNSWM